MAGDVAHAACARGGRRGQNDKVAVPVALGHYEDKIDLIQQISDAEKINDGVAIALYGLNAARQQFQLHGRENATRIVIMITNGRNRGNAAPAAEDLRESYNVQLFVLAVGADSEGMSTLKRIAGNEYPDRVYEVASASKMDEQTAAISRHLCGYTTPAHGVTPTDAAFHHTTKRDVQAMSFTSIPWGAPRSFKFSPLCSDGIKRPYQFNLLVDVTARSSPEDFRLVMDHLSMFFQKRFAPNDNMLLFNIMTVNSEKVLDARASLTVGEIGFALNDISQNSEDVESARLGLGIDSLAEMSNENYIYGSYRIMLIISADSTSRDPALPSAEYAAGDFSHNVIGLSVRKPSTDLLTQMAGAGTSTTAKMVHDAVVFLVDVVHDGVFPKVGKRACSPRAKGAVIRSRVELGDNGNVGQAILAIEDDVVDLVVELATGGFPGPS
ncbi:unnamed protein product [Heligmosomoides polygyrus]|uniref:VWFA domain-containing protein n=1 Tax=Heligmosomoides polygyrus TaxID=6339 RepID=A0A183GNI2_HELPZ|nr:unnamed protein product [Heligmosomoides polygyrus]